MSRLASVLGQLLDYILPPRCAGCGQIVSADRQLCVDCWQSLDFITASGCNLCGDPAIADGQTCLKCLAQPPVHDGVRAAVAYGDMARTIVLRLKHGGRTGLVPLVADAMRRNILDQNALLIPVPLHRWRIWSRGFNQSALIARRLAVLTGLAMHLDALQRVRPTPLLRGLGAKARTMAVTGAFAVRPHARKAIEGRTIYLIDDVFTSGATANACSRSLKRAGAKAVVVICWARVIRDRESWD